jgi:hypothetical protein
MDEQEKALKLYRYQLDYCRKYNNEHKDEIKQKMKSRYQRIKDDPEKYEQFRAKKREYYKNKKAQKAELTH